MIDKLKTKISDLEKGINSPATPDGLKSKLREQLEKAKDELTSLESSKKSPGNISMTNKKSSDDDINDPLVQSILSTLKSIMGAGSGTGIDSPQVRDMIAAYLKDKKVKLSELDQSVLDEIKRNQLIKIELPEYGKVITVDSDTADIPNFYEIIDDILAGNNVYLIGEAGGGKTFTAEKIAEALQRKRVTLNCSQYTSPLDILGGQSIEGFKEGKLIDCWKNGKILILDEMPKLDPNTAGLLNDALAKSSKTRPDKDATINSANTSEPPIQRAKEFGVIATGNIYPNEPPAPQYRGNNQQDLSLLDRFSGSVYYTEFDFKTDQKTTRYQFLFNFLVGNYYEYIKAKMEGKSLPPAMGLRTVIESMNLKNLALVSYRTNVAFRVGFEYELVRAMAKSKGKDVGNHGKTFLKTFKSYMVAFGREGNSTYNNIITATKYTDFYIQGIVEDAIKEISKDKFGFMNSLTPIVAKSAKGIFESYEDFFAPKIEINKP